jgi:hypothetical protein
MRRTLLVVAALAVLVVGCGQRDGDIAVEDDEPTPQPTVTVTVTATPEPDPEPEPDEPDEDEPVAAEDPCDDPPTDQPFIFVTSPTAGEQVSSPFTVTGCSDTFEANVEWELRDADDDVLADGFTMGGTLGDPDDFSFEVEYSVTEQQTGTLEVFETDAETGDRARVNTIQLVLTP